MLIDTNAIAEFSQNTIEKIGYYVYLLQNPIDLKIIYIGKGRGNRVFNHVNSAINDPKKSDKLDLIRNINKTSKVKHYIVRHGISNEEIALEIEATLIDLFTNDNFEHLTDITNIVSGHNTWLRGIKSVNEIELLYSAPMLKADEIKHNILVININKSFNDNLSIYEATRKYWRVDKRRVQKIDLVFSEYRGIVRAIFKPLEWHRSDDGKRMYFKGEMILDAEIQEMYLNKELEYKRGKRIQNPIYYLTPKVKRG